MVYSIGLVEDVIWEASEVMLSLKENASGCLDDNSFLLYELKQETGFREELYGKIRNDILENKIQCLIVDYKLDTMYEIVEGIEIVAHFHALVSEFPVYILTNVPDTGKENDLADPDKVYAKKVFLNPDSEITKTMVYNIIRNIKRYSKRRAELEAELDAAFAGLMNAGKYSDPVYDRLLETERMLSKYKPLELSVIDESLNGRDMDEAIEALKRYKELLK